MSLKTSVFIALLLCFTTLCVGNETKFNQLVYEKVIKYKLPSKRLNSILDTIFSSPDVLKDKKSLENAGFKILHERPSGLLIASHPDLNRYLIKVYPNSVPMSDEETWQRFGDRCHGAENIRLLIKEKKLKHFSVPHKWIYFSTYQKNRPILVVTKMDIVDSNESKQRWKLASKKEVKELFHIIHRGYASSCLFRNIPYTTTGQFACIDTEYPKRTPRYENVKNHLSEEMKVYWDELLQKAHIK
jgi:hypothetical protein